MLQLGFKKGRVLIQKRAFSERADMLKEHFYSCDKTLKHMFKIKFGIYTANTSGFFFVVVVTLAFKLKNCNFLSFFPILSSPEPKAHKVSL